MILVQHTHSLWQGPPWCKGRAQCSVDNRPFNKTPFEILRLQPIEPGPQRGAGHPQRALVALTCLVISVETRTAPQDC